MTSFSSMLHVVLAVVGTSKNVPVPSRPDDETSADGTGLGNRLIPGCPPTLGEVAAAEEDSAPLGAPANDIATIFWTRNADLVEYRP